MQSGVLKKWLDNKNYGFITPDGSDQDIFVHRTQFVGLSEESGLQEGQQVVFNQISDDKGRIRAENVNGPNGSLVLVGRTPSNPFGRVRGRGFGRGDRGRGGRGGRGGFENRPFDGNCNSCGAQGHRSRECPSNPGQGPVDGQYGRSNFRTNSPSGGYDNNRGRGGRYPSAFSRGRRGGRGGDYNGRGRGRFGGDDQQGGRGGFGDRNFGDSGDRGRGRGGRGRGRGGRRGGGDFNRGGYSDRGHGDSGRGAFSSPPPQQYNPFSRPSYNSSDAPQRFDAGGRGLGGGQFSNNRQPGRGGSFPNSGRFGSPDGQRGGFGGRF